MIIERFYLQCLSHASYILWDKQSRNCLVIDPQRDIGGYQNYIEKNNLILKGIIETHIHADFVSGHQELAKNYSVPIYYGQKAQINYPVIHVKDGDKLQLGQLLIEFLETPGHTPESICILVKDPTHNFPDVLFTGDTLFVGDVGRPDLLGAKMPAEILAGMLFKSIQRLKKLPAETRIYPAHGAGSSCGKTLGTEAFSTMGEQISSNYALKDLTEKEFIHVVTEDQPEAPKYFSMNAAQNKMGVSSLEDLLAKMKYYPYEEILDYSQNPDNLILDTRDPQDFAQGHIPGSINIGLDGQFASWLGTLLDPTKNIYLISEPSRIEESFIRCARVGFENIKGVIRYGYPKNSKIENSFIRLNSQEFNEKIKEEVFLLDVRKKNEVDLGKIPHAHWITLSKLTANLESIPKDKPILLYCGGGYRSSIAASILLQNKFSQVYDLIGGFRVWEQQNREISK